MIDPSFRVVEIEERGRHLFSREDLFGPDGRSLIFRATQALSVLELRERFSGLEIRALGVAGYLPLTRRISLNIRPQFPLANLWALLAWSDERFELFLDSIRLYRRSQYAPPHQMIARSFCFFLRRIMRLGFPYQYSPFEFQGFFRPKVDFGQTVHRFLARGNTVSVYGNEHTLSRNSRLNRVLKAACAIFLRMLPESGEWSGERRLLRDSLHALALTDKITPHPTHMNFIGELPWWARADYTGALETFFLYKGYSGIGFEYDSGGITAPSFMFRLNEVFEQFVRNVLRDKFKNLNISVVNGNKMNQPVALFHDNKTYRVRPDAIASFNDAPIAIVDMKYKYDISERDRYQGISHTLAVGAPLCIWITPAKNAEGSGLQYEGSLSTGQRFFRYGFDLSGNVDEKRDEMTSTLLRLIA